MPMQRKLLIAVAATLVLVGCSDSKPAEPTPGKPEVAKVKTMKEIDPEAYHSNIESAMAEIPQTDMANFQQVFLCEMTKNNQSPTPRPIAAVYVLALSAHIKSNPTSFLT